MDDLTCSVCMARLPIRSGPGRPRIYCSRACSQIASRRREEFVPSLRECALASCSVMFLPKSRANGCCSPQHGMWHAQANGRANGTRNPPGWTDARRDSYHRRKARKRGTSSADQPVRLAAIAARDRNRCHLCGKKVPAKTWPHPLSPSLDHVVPLSKGGEHSPANVRLAHLVCNTAKGNRGGGEQLLLIG